MTGGTDKILRVYNCIPGLPVLLAEVLGHMVREICGHEGVNVIVYVLNLTLTGPNYDHPILQLY